MTSLARRIAASMRRDSSSAEIPCLVCVMWNMARNHTVRLSLVAAKIVPAVSEVWVRQALHCHSACFFNSQCAACDGGLFPRRAKKG